MTIPDWFYRCLGIGMLMLSVSGCIMPAPPYSIDEEVEVRRDSIGQSLPHFQPGVTTRRDVILALGVPDAVSVDECKLIYWSPKDVMSWLVYVPLGMSHVRSDWDVDYFVAEFDARGLLVDFKEEESWPELVPLFSSYGGHKVLFQHEAEMIKVDKWLPDYFKLKGVAIFTETELVFMSHKLIANAPADLRLAYSSITEERITGFMEEAIWVHCRSGDEYKFKIEDQHGDGEPLQEAHRILQSQLTH